ncbi:hypothetical protein BKA69DRAFT_1025347 [Paraphysoderma sedebokerense]|nr:hypothetical protein BKA69DRAFT_1025347 [Paraphysoderma sedebokerense]
MSYIIYDFFVLVFSSIISVFFREIKSRGSHKIPPFGPVIFVVAPHHNQFVDPLILMKTCKRRVGFLAAQKTMDRRYVGAFAKALQSIGVTRAQDIAKPGTGTVYYPDPRNAPNIIKGHNTKFTQELKPSWAIALPKNLGSADVVEIISDTEIRLKKPFKDDEAVAALSTPEGTSFKAVPHVDYSVVYNKVFERLNLGRCIGIFPEGGSHDRSELLPLKAGATIMALGAMAANPTLDVKVVPVGLSYFHADKFRSRAVVEYGDPISIPKELVEKYKNGGQDKRNACSALLETIHAGLKAVTVTAPDYGTLMVVQAVRRLYRPLNRRLTVVQKLEFTRRLIKGYLHYRDDPRIKDLEQKVLNYNQMLKYHGLQDHQVEKTAIGGFRAMQLLIERLSLLVLVGIIALPGAILNAPIAIMASKVSKRKAKEGLAASSVKIEGRDLLATWKLISACILVPTFYIGYTIIAYLLAWKFLGYPWTVVAPIATFYGVPIMSYLALIFGESWRDVYKSLPPLFFSILPTRWSSSQNLRQARAALSRDLNDIINELVGPLPFFIGPSACDCLVPYAHTHPMT